MGPAKIKNNPVFREALINGSRGLNNQIDYIALYNKSNPRFDNPDYVNPTIWGSLDSYIMSQYAFDLKNTHFMNTSFVTVGSEPLLRELVSDLYQQKVPFLANMYALDDNFGVVANHTTGQLQEFEKLAFPRNPDQSAYDPCFIAQKCQYPISPIMKLANIRLQERYPEAHEFFQGFTMSTTQVNKVVSIYLDQYVNNASLGATEKWLKTACSWLKSTDPAVIATWNVSSWLVDVKRYDCSSECGFTLNGTDNIGGHCNHYTGECECDYPQIFADTNCTESCPGLIGPSQNSSGQYVFTFCSGNGVCDIITRECKCYNGWEGSACDIFPTFSPTNNPIISPNNNTNISSTDNIPICSTNDTTPGPTNNSIPQYADIEIFGYKAELNPTAVTLSAAFLIFIIILSCVFLSICWIFEHRSHKNTKEILYCMMKQTQNKVDENNIHFKNQILPENKVAFERISRVGGV